MPQPPHSSHNRLPIVSRLSAALEHVPAFAFRSQTSLARAAGVSQPSVGRLVDGRSDPSFAMVARITEAIERELGRRIDPRELFAVDGRFLSAPICQALGCPGCLSDRFYGPDGIVKPEFAGLKPGEWTGLEGRGDYA